MVTGAGWCIQGHQVTVSHVYQISNLVQSFRCAGGSWQQAWGMLQWWGKWLSVWWWFVAGPAAVVVGLVALGNAGGGSRSSSSRQWQQQQGQ